MPSHLSHLHRINRRLTLRFVVQSFCFYHFLSEYGLSIGLPRGPSMLPTLAVHGDTTWTSSRYRHGKGIAVGDLVLFKHPYVVGVEAIKRVVGMPGDFVMRDVHDEGGSQVMLQV